MAYELRNPYLNVLKLGAKTELYTPPTATLDIFTDGIRTDIDHILKKFPIVLGQAGSGKSNGVGRILEQVLDKKMQIFLVDFAGEHLGIVEFYKETFKQIDMAAEAPTAAKEFIESNTSYYLDCSKVDRETYLTYIDVFLGDFFKLKIAQEVNQRKPTLFVFEEAHNFIPEGVNQLDIGSKTVPRIKEHLRKFALEGRKYGCPCILITQRPSLADKSIISQSRLGIYLKATYPNDVKRYQELIPGMVLRHLRPVLFRLLVGQCFYVIDGKVSIRRFKRKKSRDLGETPGYAQALGWKEGKGVNTP
jgi:DNA helicase HerA-like ATPase